MVNKLTEINLKVVEYEIGFNGAIIITALENEE